MKASSWKLVALALALVGLAGLLSTAAFSYVGEGGNLDNCEDAEDNDGDAFVDCADAECGALWICGGIEEACEDSADNDGDSQTDCADADCIDGGHCATEQGATGFGSCADDLDNDRDGQTDGEDADCEEGENGYGCADAADNDGDSQADCADPGCDGVTVGSYSCEQPEASCADGEDNDADGSADAADSDCPPASSSGRSQPTVTLPTAADAFDTGATSTPAGDPGDPEARVEPATGTPAAGEASPAPGSLPALPDLPEGCDPFLTLTLGPGRANPPAEVLRAQSIVGALLSLVLPQTGVFDAGTQAAVEAFQLAHEDQILRPWGEEVCPGGECRPTGVVGLATRRFVNRLVCGR